MASDDPQKRHARDARAAAWVAVAAGGISALCLILLLLHALGGPDADTARPLLWTVGVSALAALAAAALALRHRPVRPVAMEGVELALVALTVLALILFFYYVIPGPGYS